MSQEELKSPAADAGGADKRNNDEELRKFFEKKHLIMSKLRKPGQQESQEAKKQANSASKNKASPKQGAEAASNKQTNQKLNKSMVSSLEKIKSIEEQIKSEYITKYKTFAEKQLSPLAFAGRSTLAQSLQSKSVQSSGSGNGMKEQKTKESKNAGEGAEAPGIQSQDQNNNLNSEASKQKEMEEFFQIFTINPYYKQLKSTKSGNDLFKDKNLLKYYPGLYKIEKQASEAAKQRGNTKH